MNKETFLKQKINNFSIFIKEKIGEENKIYKEFLNYQNDLAAFLRDIIQLSKVPINEDLVKNYMEIKGVDKKLSKADMEKIKRYFEMFVKIINS
jgi:hypothetical protein